MRGHRAPVIDRYEVPLTDFHSRTRLGNNSLEQERLSSLQALRAPLGICGVAGSREFDEENVGRPDAGQDNGIRFLHDDWAGLRHGLY